MEEKKMFNRKEDRNRADQEPRFAGFLSLLFTIITSGEFWRCIRWCDEGTTVFITSPKLFEREVLQKEGKDLNAKDFETFVGLLEQSGFQRVLNKRASKVQKFRHPRFQKTCEEKTEKQLVEPQRKRKLMNTSGEETQPEIKKSRKILKPRKSIVNQTSVGYQRSTKRKRSTSDMECSEISTHDSKRKCTAQHNPCASSNQRIYSPAEMTAAHALLSLSIPVIHDAPGPMELMAAQALVNLSRSCVVPVHWTEREKDAAHALLDFGDSINH